MSQSEVKKSPSAASETAEAAQPAAATQKSQKKNKKRVAHAIMHVKASFSNTIVTFTDAQGNVIAQSSSGSVGFVGSRRGTPFAAQLAAETAGKEAKECGVRTVVVKVNGPGPGRESPIRALNSLGGIEILTIIDTTPVPHNGCRPPKRRRV